MLGKFHFGSVSTGSLKEFIQVIVAVIEFGHIKDLPTFTGHHIADTIVALSAGVIPVQESADLAMLTDIVPRLLDIIHRVQHYNITGRTLAALHYLPGQEIPESFKDGHLVGSLGL